MQSYDNPNAKRYSAVVALVLFVLVFFSTMIPTVHAAGTIDNLPSPPSDAYRHCFAYIGTDGYTECIYSSSPFSESLDFVKVDGGYRGTIKLSSGSSQCAVFSWNGSEWVSKGIITYSGHTITISGPEGILSYDGKIIVDGEIIYPEPEPTIYEKLAIFSGLLPAFNSATGFIATQPLILINVGLVIVGWALIKLYGLIRGI